MITGFLCTSRVHGAYAYTHAYKGFLISIVWPWYNVPFPRCANVCVVGCDGVLVGSLGGFIIGIPELMKLVNLEKLMKFVRESLLDKDK